MKKQEQQEIKSNFLKEAEKIANEELEKAKFHIISAFTRFANRVINLKLKQGENK